MLRFAPSTLPTGTLFSALAAMTLSCPRGKMQIFFLDLIHQGDNSASVELAIGV